MLEHLQKIYLRWLLVFLVVLVLTIAPRLDNSNPISVAQKPTSETNNTSRWQQVPIGGGGYVTGIYVHPQVPDLVYMQTDNGGAYRWLPQQKKWQNIIDRFPRLPWNDYGVEAMVLDRHNPDLVYLALGKYTSVANGKLWKSSDRGNTWTESDLTVPMGGDEDKRWGGNRLAVSPHNSNYLLFGSRTEGLWKSGDGGLHWSQINNFGASPREDVGLISVAFDPRDTEQVYLSAYGDGIYQSHDAGWTWTKMVGSPVRGMQIEVASDHSVYVTSDTAPGVSRYIDDVWQNITPSNHKQDGFNALSVRLSNPQQVLVALGDVSGGKIFYSANGGKTWQHQQARPQPQPAVPWWPDYFFNDHTSAIAFDPNYTNRVWLSDWFGVWRTNNIRDKRSTWTNYPQGHEQLVTLDLISPPKGASLISGVADMEGFYHQSLTAYPQDRLGHKNPQALKHWDRYWQDTYGLAYCASKPLNLVRVGGRRDDVLNIGATSTDGGQTWHKFKNFPDDAIPLRVAISPTNPQQFVVIRSGSQPLQTKDRGKSWQQVSGLPDGIVGPWNWAQPLAADGVRRDRFYYYGEGGTLYRSDDGGVTFLVVNTSLPSVDKILIKTMPGKEEEIWLSLDREGLYYSQDGGVNFTQIPQITESRLISFGKPNKNKDLPLLYLYGKVKDKGGGLFRSSDRGKTWQKLNDFLLPNPENPEVILVLEASNQESGLVFLGTDGRGIYYRHFETF